MYEGRYSDDLQTTHDFWVPKENGGGFSNDQFPSDCRN